MNILLVSPATPATFWSFQHVLPFVSRKAAFPPLGLLTIAAMLPRTWDLRLVDLNVAPLRDKDLAWADYVLLSAMIVHEPSVRQVIARCRAAGRRIIAGGPLFTTAAERFPEVDHLVLGEAEELMPTLVADIEAGHVQPRYLAAGRPSLTLTPIPRWDLIRMRDYVTMSLQFSRGCPFDCEFCDIVSLFGHRPRLKTIPQMIAEFDALYAAGWREAVFLVDDNFIGHKGQAKALLRALVQWQRQRRHALPLLTEASLNLADDPELMELMVQAGFAKVFIGVETPDEKSLAECAKVQNTRRDLVAAVRTIQQAGLEVMGGFIVGFDNDRDGIFARQRRFIQEAGVVTAMVGLLTALPRTRLFDRLQSEGRLRGVSDGNNLTVDVNYEPRMDRAALLSGYRRLVRHLYAPRVYYRRALNFLRFYRPRGPRVRVTLSEYGAFLKSLWVLGVRSPGRRAFWAFMLRSLVQYPRAFATAMNLAITGYHFRRVAADL